MKIEIALWYKNELDVNIDIPELIPFEIPLTMVFNQIKVKNEISFGCKIFLRSSDLHGVIKNYKEKNGLIFKDSGDNDYEEWLPYINQAKNINLKIKRINEMS